MKWVFLGSGRFAAKLLSLLYKNGIIPDLVYTLPDKPQGRKLHFLPVPVMKFCLENRLNVKQILDKEDLFRESDGFDLFLVTDIGLILPNEFVTRYFCFNLHPSLLPRWRGPAPIFWALREGDAYTGLTIFRMDKGIDTGEIVYQKEVKINLDWNYSSLEEVLVNEAVVGVNWVFEGEKWRTLKGNPQVGKVSYARKINKADLRINWGQSCSKIYNLARAALPYMAPWALYDGKRIKFYEIRPNTELRAESGKVIRVGEVITIGCGSGSIDVLELQPESKKRMPARAFTSGYRVKVGSIFG